MYGEWQKPELQGIVPRAAEYLFDTIEERAAALTNSSGGASSPNGASEPVDTDEMPTEYVIKVSMVEIYNETVRDLLNPKGKNLKIRETGRQGVWVDGVSEEFATCVQVRCCCCFRCC